MPMILRRHYWHLAFLIGKFLLSNSPAHLEPNLIVSKTNIRPMGLHHLRGSYLFFHCLLSKKGHDCFPILQQKYVAEDYIATSPPCADKISITDQSRGCRFGNNLNSVNFPDFHARIDSAKVATKRLLRCSSRKNCVLSRRTSNALSDSRGKSWTTWFRLK